ncbi:MAG: AAA family ATPase [Deltaproteobacteria bacterium]|nr:AAA family ATPase [Deltaproteobacteria bacterium]
MSREDELSFEQAVSHVSSLREKIASVIFGQEELLAEALSCFLSGGHILITGAPGLAKTTLVRVIARNLGLQFGRVQFTPDLMPSDIIGGEILNVDPDSQKRTFSFIPGPVFANFVLADEINRASPRTQSALLEAMQERRVTVAGAEHPLPRPFMVFATQNPFDAEGTFPLPEAQLDRFLLHAIMSYPDQDAEMKILRDHSSNRLVGEGELSRQDSGALTPQLVSGLLRNVHKVRLAEELLSAIRELVRSSRPHDPNCPEHIAASMWYGAGPRAGISLVSLSRAYALLEGKEAVSWQHVKRMAKPALRHRVRLTVTASRDRMSTDDAIDELIENLEARHHDLAKGAGG